MTKREKSNKVARRGGRTKLYDFDVTVPLTYHMRDMIELQIANGETRVDFIRAAIAAEIERRTK